jgi:hypothetical protein
MGSVKTRYRKYRDGGAVPLTPAAHIAADKATADLVPAIESAVTIPDVQDDASAAFQRQIDALRKSEQIQRDRAATASQRAAPPGRSEIIADWKSKGLTNLQESYLRANERMVDNPGVLAEATKAAHLAGHQVDSLPYFEAITNYFDRHMGPAPVEPEEAEPAPAPKRDRGGGSDDSLPSSKSNGVRYSAPVNRETASTGYARGNTPDSIRLTVAEKEAAAFSGLTLREYAEQLIELRRRKSEGDYGGAP